jgi:hypothetical protein
MPWLRGSVTTPQQIIKILNTNKNLAIEILDLEAPEFQDIQNLRRE